jgi:hypothetical protein
VATSTVTVVLLDKDRMNPVPFEVPKPGDGSTPPRQIVTDGVCYDLVHTTGDGVRQYAWSCKV